MKRIIGFTHWTGTIQFNFITLAFTCEVSFDQIINSLKFVIFVTIIKLGLRRP